MRILAVLLCSSLVLAQAEPGVLRYVPKKADLIVRMAGPASFAKSFAETSLGKALADPQVVPFWSKFVTHFQVQMELDAEGLSPADQARMAKAYELLLGYEGEVLFTARGDWGDIFETEKLSGAAAFAWSGGDKAAEIAKLVGEILPDANGELEVGGVAASLRQGDGVQWLGPLQHEGHMVLLVGQKLEEHAKWFFEDTANAADTAALRKDPFAMVMRLHRFREFAIEMLALESPIPRWFLLQMGLDAIDELGFYAFPDGKLVGQRIEMSFGDAPRGLLGVMCPPKMGRPSLLDYRPADAGNYSIGAFDAQHLVKVYETTFAKFGDEIGIERAQVEQMFTKMTKLDLIKDVLAHIGNEYMRIEDLSGDIDWDEDEGEPASVQRAKEQYGESCYVLKLTDGKAFAKSLDTAIRARGLHVARKRETYGETKIYRMTLLGMFEIEYAVTHSMLILGVGSGEATKRNVRAVIDNIAAVAAGDGPEFRPEVATRIAHLPAGWGGIQVGSLIEILDMILKVGESMQAVLAEEDMTLADMEGPWKLLMDGSRALKGVMDRHGVGMIVNLDYFEKDRYVMRSRW